MPKIKIEKELYEKAKKVAEELGYSSIDEFVSHVLENTMRSSTANDDDEEVIKRLQGLGYIA